MKKACKLGLLPMVIIWIHNAAFEFSFISGLYPFRDDEVFFRDIRKPIYFRMYDAFEFRCSYIQTNLSLAALTKQTGVKMKLSPVKTIVKGKRVVLVDDSIVRGTTSLKIVKMLREAGASEVHVRIASAPLKYTCYYGVDVHTPQELISNSNSVEQVCKLIDADSLAFLSHEGMLAAGHRDDLCLACFNHKYPTKIYED